MIQNKIKTQIIKNLKRYKGKNKINVSMAALLSHSDYETMHVKKHASVWLIEQSRS